jgi:hypothetical protein
MFSRKRINIMNASLFESCYPNSSYKAMLNFAKNSQLPPENINVERWAAMCISVSRGNTVESDCDPI